MQMCKEEHRETDHRPGSHIMVGAASFRPCVVSAKVVSTLGHFGLIWIVISNFCLLTSNIMVGNGNMIV